MALEITVNGNVLQIDVPLDTPLLWVLREEIGLKGTKFGCGMGLCGSCTVHLGSTAVRSCITPIEAVVGSSVTTIEGLAQPNSSGGQDLHPLQQAWISHSVPQCGYCQSGQIMAAASLLASNPNPTEDEIRTHMSGNICRCGTYSAINAAIQEVARTTAQQDTQSGSHENKQEPLGGKGDK